jgi:hypothetical protein
MKLDHVGVTYQAQLRRNETQSAYDPYSVLPRRPEVVGPLVHNVATCGGHVVPPDTLHVDESRLSGAKRKVLER